MIEVLIVICLGLIVLAFSLLMLICPHLKRMQAKLDTLELQQNEFMERFAYEQGWDDWEGDPDLKYGVSNDTRS